jgi:L-lysine exporter family protein LysE/ArgO
MSQPALLALATGFALMASLIVAIGAQNAFVLRQGLARRHVGPIVAFCAAADALLTIAGVLGLGGLLRAWPGLADALTLGGALFLAAYGVRALWKALEPGALAAGATAAPLSLAGALSQCAGFTLLNPHVYLDTVLLMGSVAQQQAATARPWFVFGACLASAAWFAALGYGARALAPWFARPAAWRVLDAAVGLTMLALALLLWRGRAVPT